MPLKEYGYTLEIDSTNLGLKINYHIIDWYIFEKYYLEKSLIYNSVSIFALINNVEYLNYNFSGKSYKVTRKQIEEYYPNYEKIIQGRRNKNNFNKYLESKINDDVFIDSISSKIIISN